METNNLDDYIQEIKCLSREENSLYTEVGLNILENLRKVSKGNIQRENQISSLLNVIYCHRIGMRKTA